jgi:hypothetical protein
VFRTRIFCFGDSHERCRLESFFFTSCSMC